MQDDDDTTSPVHGVNPWPDHLPGLKSKIQNYFSCCLLVGEALMRGKVLLRFCSKVDPSDVWASLGQKIYIKASTGRAPHNLDAMSVWLAYSDLPNAHQSAFPSERRPSLTGAKLWKIPLKRLLWGACSPEIRSSCKFFQFC